MTDNNKREVTDDEDDYTITVEENVEPSEDAIDLEDVFEGRDEKEASRELLRRLGASEDEIDEVMEEQDSE